MKSRKPIVKTLNLQVLCEARDVLKDKIRNGDYFKNAEIIEGWRKLGVMFLKLQSRLKGGEETWKAYIEKTLVPKEFNSTMIFRCCYLHENWGVFESITANKDDSQLPITLIDLYTMIYQEMVRRRQRSQHKGFEDLVGKSAPIIPAKVLLKAEKTAPTDMDSFVEYVRGLPENRLGFRLSTSTTYSEIAAAARQEDYEFDYLHGHHVTIIRLLYETWQESHRVSGGQRWTPDNPVDVAFLEFCREHCQEQVQADLTEVDFDNSNHLKSIMKMAKNDNGVIDGVSLIRCLWKGFASGWSERYEFDQKRERKGDDM